MMFTCKEIVSALDIYIEHSSHSKELYITFGKGASRVKLSCLDEEYDNLSPSDLGKQIFKYLEMEEK